MITKVLLVNLEKPQVEVPSIEVFTTTIGSEPSLHDFHVIILDTDEIISDRWYKGASQSRMENITKNKDTFLAPKYEEQLNSGGYIFCFCGPRKNEDIAVVPIGSNFIRAFSVNSYCWLPLDMTVVNDAGNTFLPTSEDSTIYRELVKSEQNQISWTCYLSKLPTGTKIFATNRARYPLLADIPKGQGHLVMLPRFKDRNIAIKLILENIIPRVIKDDQPIRKPTWLGEYRFTFEQGLREKLNEIEVAKRLLYTKDNQLKNAVASALKQMGFLVESKPDGTLPDLEVKSDGVVAKVEVKGHDRALGSRGDVLQVLGYISEGETAKGIIICNHELETNPNTRNSVAFTEAAVDLARKNGIALISTLDLWTVVSGIIEGTIQEKVLVQIRASIMKDSGPLKLVQ